MFSVRIGVNEVYNAAIIFYKSSIGVLIDRSIFYFRGNILVI